ncbi:MAG: Rpn family recombination-promoting nuclease/putative transposase [Gemmataceae bacterium]|nr:Rpn family recombination-promoting nuclease/putative transposase [Gemmataceae bacterium]
MTTDPLFYRLFETSPETFFLLLGIPGDAAKEMAARYQYLAIEFKETSHRTDGVFLPKETDLPLYFLEVQFYARASIFADLLAKVFTYLKQHNAAQDFRGVVLFASRSLEPADTTPYRALLDAGQIRPFYLDEMPELANAPLGLSILYLIRRTESEAPAIARDLVARVKREIADAALRNDLIELIETVIIYKLARFSREEIQAMLQVKDIRETRVYQEAMEEGKKEKAARTIVNMAAKKMPPEEIAAMVEVDLEFVHQVLKGRSNG